MPVPYVLAVDGGNSKTELVLADVDGAVLTRQLLAGTRPHLDGGIAVMAAALAEGARQARASVGLQDVRPVHGVLCLANVDLPEDEVETQRALASLGVADALAVHNDTFAVLAAGTDRGWGIAVVAGAGINALGVNPDGRVHRFLALGDYTGDWGGGYSLAVAALGAAIRASDGRGDPTLLSDLVPPAFGRPDARSVAVAVHRGEITRHALLAAAPVVLAAATAGDPVSITLVQRLGDELHDFAAAAVRELDLAALDVEVVLGGGVLQSGNRVLIDRFTSRMLATAPRARLRLLDVAPVAGALVTALRAAGANQQALVRARGQLIRDPSHSGTAEPRDPRRPTDS